MAVEVSYCRIKLQRDMKHRAACLRQQNYLLLSLKRFKQRASST